VGNSYALDGEVTSTILILLHEERDLDCIYSQIFLELFRIHTWFKSSLE